MIRILTLAALAAAGASSSASAGSALQPEATRPDSAVATLQVDTKPPGLLVIVDGVKVGRAPVGPLWVAAKAIRIQALPEDPRRFEPGRDTVVVTPKAGEAVRALLDLRPTVLLRSQPEPAQLFLTSGRSDSIYGETPLRLLPARIEGRDFRLEASEHADSIVSGDALLALGAAGRPVTVALRRIAPHRPPAAPPKPPLLRRRWFQIALIGAGAALTATSAILRHHGDQWYDRYLSSSDPDEIPRFYDRTAHYDRIAGVTLGSGQVFLTTGVFFLVTSGIR